MMVPFYDFIKHELMLAQHQTIVALTFCICCGASGAALALGHLLCSL